MLDIAGTTRQVEMLTFGVQMRRQLTKLAMCLLVAGVIVLGQWFWINGGDIFSVVEHDGNQYKVFTWGFPLRVVDCNPVLAEATPPSEIPFRIVGNVILFAAVLLVLDLIRSKLRTRHCTVSAHAAET